MEMIQKGLFRVCFQPITMLNCCTTCISWEIGSYNTQQSRHNEHTHFCRNFVAKSSIWFSEDEGGGQRPFGTFPKIHPFWRRRLSLSMISMTTTFTCMFIRPGQIWELKFVTSGEFHTLPMCYIHHMLCAMALKLKHIFITFLSVWINRVLRIISPRKLKRHFPITETFHF